VAAMIHLPADVLVLHEPVTCSYLHVGVSRRPVTEHYTRWWRRISNQRAESSEHCKRESQRFTGAGLPIQQATPVRKMKLSGSTVGLVLATGALLPHRRQPVVRPVTLRSCHRLSSCALCHETEHNRAANFVAWRVCRTHARWAGLSERNLHESHTDSGSEQDKNDPG
jgi:hypothetical protein